MNVRRTLATYQVLGLQVRVNDAAVNVQEVQPGEDVARDATHHIQRNASIPVLFDGCEQTVVCEGAY
jgi:hypothetical protein